MRNLFDFSDAVLNWRNNVGFKAIETIMEIPSDSELGGLFAIEDPEPAEVESDRPELPGPLMESEVRIDFMKFLPDGSRPVLESSEVYNLLDFKSWDELLMASDISPILSKFAIPEIPGSSGSKY